MNLRILLLRNKPKIRIFFPKKSHLVIYDPLVREVFNDIVAPYRPTYLATSRELYLPIFVQACFRKLLYKDKKLIDLYIIEFLRSINPTLIGTNFEIDCRFSYFVSNLGWDTFFVQHGIYAGYFVNEDYRGVLKSSNVTDMFVFNTGVKDHMAANFKYQGNFHVIGSIMANELIDKTASSNSEAKYLYFISEWDGVNSEAVYLQAQQRVLYYCQKYCSDKSKTIKVMLRYTADHPEFKKEIAFYEDATSGRVEFAAKKSAKDNYSEFLNAYGVVFLTSTLGYELMLNEKLSVACISVRGPILGLRSEVFGWPVVRESSGVGLTNELSYEEISRVLSDLEYGGISGDLRKKLLEFDPKNNTFKSYLARKLPSAGTNNQ